MNDLLAEWAVTVGAAVGLLTAIGVILRKWIWPSIKMIRRTIIAADRLFPFAEYQLKPNHGKSLVDKIDRIDEQVQKVENSAEAHWQSLEDGSAAIATRVTEHHTELTTRLSTIERHLKPTGLPVAVTIQQEEPVAVSIVEESEHHS